LVKVVAQEPEVIKVGPEELGYYFQVYTQLVGQYWKWLSLFISILFLIIIPGVFLSGLAFWRTAKERQLAPQPKHLEGVLSQFKS